MKKIPLSGVRGKGKFALVDDWWYEYLMQWVWYVTPQGYPARSVYIKKSKGKWTMGVILMHREINKTPKTKSTDHKNGNRLDNQEGNLRSCNHSQNNQNKRKDKDSSSKYKGVSRMKGCKRWRVQIRVNQKVVYLGLFPLDKEKEAAMCYNKAALKYYGPHAYINKGITSGKKNQSS